MIVINCNKSWNNYSSSLRINMPDDDRIIKFLQILMRFALAAAVLYGLYLLFIDYGALKKTAFAFYGFFAGNYVGKRTT